MKAFNEIYWEQFRDEHNEKIRKDILSHDDSYLLGVEEDKFIQYLNDKYRLEPIKILTETKLVHEPRKVKKQFNDIHYGVYETEALECNVSYYFTGSGELFNVLPSRYCLETYDISVDNTAKILSFSFCIFKETVTEFNQEHDKAFRSVTKNLDNINNDVRIYNICDIAKSIFLNEKDKIKSKNIFFAAINVNVNTDTSSVFSVPTIKRKESPIIPPVQNKEYAFEPAMSKEMYEDLLKVIYDFGKSLERKPSTYTGKHEEDLRDLFVTILESRYEGHTATGETFNKNGKTDILLKNADDGSNLFVGECKMWKGASAYSSAINQLFDNYLTWRDSKVALILFVPNNDFTDVLEKIQETTQQHSYYVRENGKRGESSFSYIFRLPADDKKLVYVEVIAFHFDLLKHDKSL